MAVKIFTIPFNKAKQAFEEKDMQDFLLNKKLHAMRGEFFQINGDVYWTVVVDYDPIFEKSPPPVFSEPERMLYEKLQQWRRERALRWRGFAIRALSKPLEV